MPQWDFLDFLSDFGHTYPTFHLEMRAEAVDLLHKDGHVIGVKASTAEGQREIYADLVIGADGRSSIVRHRAGLKVESLGAPIDVLWFRLARRPEDGGQTLGRTLPGKIMVMLNREDYWQCAFVIPKGQFELIKQRGWKHSEKRSLQLRQSYATV